MPGQAVVGVEARGLRWAQAAPLLGLPSSTGRGNEPDERQGVDSVSRSARGRRGGVGVCMEVPLAALVAAAVGRQSRVDAWEN